MLCLISDAQSMYEVLRRPRKLSSPVRGGFALSTWMNESEALAEAGDVNTGPDEHVVARAEAATAPDPSTGLLSAFVFATTLFDPVG